MLFRPSKLNQSDFSSVTQPTGLCRRSGVSLKWILLDPDPNIAFYTYEQLKPHKAPQNIFRKFKDLLDGRVTKHIAYQGVWVLAPLSAFTFNSGCCGYLAGV